MKRFILLACLLLALLLVSCDTSSKDEKDKSTKTSVFSGESGVGDSTQSVGESNSASDESDAGVPSTGDSAQPTPDTDSSAGEPSDTTESSGTIDSNGTSESSDTADSSDTTESSGNGSGDDEPQDSNLQELFEMLEGLANYEISTVQRVDSQLAKYEYIIVGRIDGADEYMKITVGQSAEEMWYVDGMYYFCSGDTAFKATISYERYEEYRAGGIGSLAFALGLQNGWIKNFSTNTYGNKQYYEMTVDGEKYTEYLKENGISAEYLDINYTFIFDEADGLEEMNVECGYVQDGVEFKVTVTSKISGIGITAVEPPEGGDEFVDVTETIG